jgi:SPP1 gp7 family putative phage head morphogenesis protein
MTQFGPTQRLQKAYEAAIRKIVGRVLPPVEPEETLEHWHARLAARSQQVDVREASDLLARRMVEWTNILNARTWREAAAKSSHSRRLYEYLQRELNSTNVGLRMSAIVAENARLISSLPLEAASKLVDEVRKAQQSGARPKTIAKMMQSRFPKLLKSRVNLISRTETAKASTALTQARCEELDIQFYQWLNSTDQRVRDSHRNMHLVIVPWAQAPAPELLLGLPTEGHYHAGEIYNCRCTQRVILTLDDIRFPARVYWSGSIQTFNKQKFISVVAPELERRAA